MGVGDNETDGGESSRDRSSVGSFFGEDMESKDSATLKEIYNNNDQTKWSPKTFEEIRNILEERGEEIPDQSPPKRPKGPDSDLGDSGSSQQSGNAFANFLGFKLFITTRFIKGIYLLGALANHYWWYCFHGAGCRAWWLFWLNNREYNLACNM